MSWTRKAPTKGGYYWVCWSTEPRLVAIHEMFSLGDGTYGIRGKMGRWGDYPKWERWHAPLAPPSAKRARAKRGKR